MLVILLGVTGFIGSTYVNFSQPQPLKVLFKEGDVTLSDKPGYTPFSLKSAIGAGLGTSANSFVTVRPSDDSVIRLSPESRLTVTQAVSDKAEQRFKTELTLDASEIINQIPSEDNRRRKTSLLTHPINLVVRGTRFTVTRKEALSINHGINKRRGSSFRPSPPIFCRMC